MFSSRKTILGLAASAVIATAGWTLAEDPNKDKDRNPNTGSGQTTGGQTGGSGSTAGQPPGQQHHPGTLDPAMRNTRDDPNAPRTTTGDPNRPDRDRTATGQDRDRTGTGYDRDRTTVTGAAAAGSDEFSQQLQQISQDPTGAGDKLFVICASLDNQAEIELARQAQQKSRNEQVRQIAQKMVQDHERMGQELQQVAQQLNVQPIRTLPAWKQAEMRALLSLPEDQFNKAYLSHLKAAHAKEISKFQDQAQLAQNDQVKQFAQQSLPHLREHRQQVAQAAQQIGLASPDMGEVPGSDRGGR